MAYAVDWVWWSAALEGEWKNDSMEVSVQLKMEEVLEAEVVEDWDTWLRRRRFGLSGRSRSALEAGWMVYHCLSIDPVERDQNQFIQIEQKIISFSYTIIYQFIILKWRNEETYLIRIKHIPTMIVQLGQCFCSIRSIEQRTAPILIGASIAARIHELVPKVGLDVDSMPMPFEQVNACWELRVCVKQTNSTRRGIGRGGGRWRRRGRSIDHHDEALLGRRELRNIMLGMGTTDMLLHGAISLLLQ